ncbi:hypothetical protein DNU06_02320 [Putridiphycobacter roseus]|uniref:FMN-binding domain-containing protein n=1 Tax=Putridiphycobacter roseus TaxID=2219161 RepID=A0A2W1N4B6_9FLAO|nr:FMN-binding protein [Putridiphycobacter roseus]PZE18684.1 hypothetical protein DNU06_02320 [Putridiphycobacter roseus]
MNNRFSNDKRKWIATIVVSAFFLFFWIYGPLQGVITPFFNTEKDVHHVKPILVKERQHHYNQVKNIGEMETKGDGYRLITRKREAKPHSKVIHFEETIANKSEYGKALLANAIKLYEHTPDETILRQTEHLFFVEIIRNKERTYYFQSKGLTNQIQGYSGPINLGIFIDENAKITNMHHVSSHETVSYLKKIASTYYYDQYKNKSLKEIHQIDAISGATITTKAMALTTTELVAMANPDPIENLSDSMGLSNFQMVASLTLKWLIHISVIFILFLYAFQKKLRKSKKFVLLTAAVCVIYIGFFLNDSFTYVTFMHPFIGTSLSSFMGLYALFVLLGAIWGKNTYCKHICPYGNIQRLQLHLTKGLNKKFFLKNKRIKQVRFTILFFLVIGILAGYRNLSHLEPFPYIFGFEVESLWFFIFSVVGLLMNWVYPMIWCRLLCPTGSILDSIMVVSSKKQKNAHT